MLSVIDKYKPLFDAPVKQWQNSAQSTIHSVPGLIPSDDNQFTFFFFTFNFFLIFSCFFIIPFYLCYLKV